MPLVFRPSHLWDEETFKSLFEEANAKRGAAADLYETDESVVAELAIPGFKPEDITIDVVDDILTVSGESKQEEAADKRQYHWRQLRRGAFSQSLSLPSEVDADKAQAKFDNGMLTVTLPKAEAAKPKRIQIS